MSRQYIDDHQIISKYLGGELSDHERTEFEAYWAEHPELIEELEVDARLESGFAHLRKSGRLDALISVRPTRRSVWPIALAASLIAGVGIAVWMGAERTARPIALAVSVAALNEAYVGSSRTLQSIDLLPVRSTLYDAVIELPKKPAALELHVLPEGVPKSSQYQISLLQISSDGKRVQLGAIDGLQPDADDFLTVYVDSARLVPGQYELRVAGAKSSSSGQSGSFLIKVNPTMSR